MKRREFLRWLGLLPAGWVALRTSGIPLLTPVIGRGFIRAEVMDPVPEGLTSFCVRVLGPVSVGDCVGFDGTDIRAMGFFAQPLLGVVTAIESHPYVPTGGWVRVATHSMLRFRPRRVG